jgi:hypothetical protein
MSFSPTNIIPPWHRTFIDGLSISFRPSPDAIDGEFGGTYVPPAKAVQVAPTASPATRTCRYCQTMQQSARPCDHCSAPDDGDRGSLAMAPTSVIRV